jgi:hypothetical protein
MQSVVRINELLTRHLYDAFDWDTFSNNSETQHEEKIYSRVVAGVIRSMGGRIGSFASSQQSKDIRDVIFPSTTRPITYECKKSSTANTFKLNDTVPSENDNYYYIFIDTKKKKISIKHCSELIKNKNASNWNKCHVEELNLLYDNTLKTIQDAVNDGRISYYDYGEIFKKTVIFPNGLKSLKSRPRPNWTFTNKEN